MPATELRVRLGEALRSLEDGDIVIEKGGVPVAVLSRYPGTSVDSDADRRDERSYGTAISRKADRSAAALKSALEAMDEGWAGLEVDETIENIYRWREEGLTSTYADLNEREENKVADGPPAGHRYMYRTSRKGRGGQKS